ncbi:histone-lysine N-methyltransferase SETDB1-B-like isoform X2 [Melanotaenia boesemani]|nr:histone-lysine N-methyltransferase SETDB1-B-like isoform X2 [Melanotaenia boesemani]XP_041866621.1 histone-lysine N-methyltransferase SETDB1-B-like isoform X2 [Melanotaenia boesemani]XP_041866622.1 histone-lysine N-methyltransferase SETDB1-B-like isoform X2 [Melanotaenia boesemani]
MEVDVLDDLDPRTLALKNYMGIVENHNENLTKSTHKSIHSLNETSRKTRRCQSDPYFINVKKKAVVVLNRLPECTINALQHPTPQQFHSEAESPGSPGSDMSWQPEDDSDDSDFSVSNNKPKPSKSPKCDRTSKSAPGTSSNDESVAEGGPVVESSAFAHSSSETTKVRPDLPEVELKLDMVVLARKRAMRWQRGKIVEVVTKEDGRLKFKVGFEEKGKSLVSGHHIAFENTPKLDQLYVGARVVIQSPDDKLCFMPGILSELPSRKNRLRFLVFLDDHTPLYVGLPSLHLVCKPLEDALEDIPDNPHKGFMKQYLKNWPYPHLTHYKADQSINVEVNGVQQKCKVEMVDCSLIKVVFESTQSKEWIHRGSVRLEHMAKFLKFKETRKAQNNSDPQ